MRSWQIFAIGVLTLFAILFLPLYESLIAGVGALAIVGLVAFGFLLRPKRDTFTVRTATRIYDPDHNLYLERGLVAIKVEVVRLWLLFVPTFLALAFLVIVSTRRSAWHFSLLALLFNNEYGQFVPFGLRVVVLIEFGALSIWITERLTLRDAEACSAKSVSIWNGRLSFMFIVGSGSYYSGEGVVFNLVRPPAMARLVLYDVRRPQRNKIGMGLLFHRPIILANGVNDLDHETATSRIHGEPGMAES